ncbi:MAG: tRNA (N6-isopentenyl adenosine(37)-C2)-methylthiotransferase MiaB, partial [Clostridia bacterium]|nr:tRNA (N6-isopentenyl adenosine(37)-C2)-methylthiotransferase MiaB [Clostridia bacterium]
KPDVIETVTPYRTSYPNAWVNIMYGCNNFCSYCIVPYVRGRERSREPELIIEEVKSLVKAGYKEITLLGQNVDSYGSDRTDGANFYTLLTKLKEIDGKFRLRFMTSHPKDLSEEVIKLIAETPNFCNNIHLPVQAGSNAVLKAMNRKYDRERYFYLIDTIRKYMPDCGITSDIMVGFPGETEEDFQDTLDLVNRVKYHNAFTFIYSPRKGTVAAKMEQIPYVVKKDRITRLIALQNQITLTLSEEYVGKVKEVLVEDAPKANLLCGRTDCGRLVNFSGDKSLIGQFVNVRIDKNKASALWGEIVNE